MKMISNYSQALRVWAAGLTPELLNDLIQEKPDNVGTALRRYLETGLLLKLKLFRKWKK